MALAGTLTFLFTDIEDSSRHWDERPETMGRALRRHDERIAAAVANHNGSIFKHTGDGVDAVFGTAVEAIAAAIEIQHELIPDGWKVRIAIHSGGAEERDGDFFGPTLNRCGRLRDAAHGGQIVCSEATADLARDDLVPPTHLYALGEVRLRGLSRPEVVYEVRADGLPADFPPLRVENTSNLPVVATSFIGRRGERAELEKALASQRLVTLVGMGGVGKTRLAIEVAASKAETSGTVWYVDLAAVPDDGVLGGAIAQVVGVPLGDPRTTLMVQSVRSLERRRGLLLLDNCEHLIDACSELCAMLLARCPDVIVLATSREALNVEGERTITLGPFGSQTDATSDDPAVRLFEDRAAAVRSGFRIDDSTRDAVEDICRRLDGLPLAIELAAARVGHLSPQQISARLDDRFRLLTGPRRKVGRQQTLEAAMDWSYNLLSDDERRLLRLLSAFLGAFRLEVVESMWSNRDGAMDVLGSLVAKSLVVADVDADPPRYRLLETVRQYAWRRLVEADEVTEARTLHRDALLADLEALPQERAWLSTKVGERLLAEFADIDAAIRWTEELGDLVLLARLVVGSGGLWLWSTHIGAARDRLDGILQSADLDAELRTDCLAMRAHAGLMLAEPDVADTARRATEEPGLVPTPGLAWAWSVRAIVESSVATDPVREASAWHCIEESRTVLQGLASAWRSWPWGELLSRVQLGDLDGAIPVAEAALRGTPDPAEYWGVDAAVRGTLTAVLHVRGRDAEAAELTRGVLDNLRAQRFVFSEATFFPPVGIGIAFALDGDHDGAREFCRSAAQLLGANPVPLMAGDIVLTLAALAVMEGDADKASRLLAALMESGRRGGYAFVLRSPVSAVVYRHYVGIVREALGPDRAAQMREEGRRMSLDEAIAYGLADSPR